MKNLSGESFLVTGGASGLGAACVRMLTGAGARVTIADLNPPATPPSGDVRFVPTDVTDAERMQAAVDTAVSAFGGLRGVVCCAGIELAERVLGKTGPHLLESFMRVLQVNVAGTFNAIRLAAPAIAAMPPLEDGERGAIVATASIAADDGQVGQAAYSASKAAVVGMTLPIARELARFGIRMATIAPGVFETPLFARLGDAVRQSLSQQMPFPKRLGAPEEFAQLAEQILRNSMINGTVLRLDGGLRMAGK
jgi:NAD(P)-dependent dehydrogenase (short-subunit alcohol dehydrogenase family)